MKAITLMISAHKTYKQNPALTSISDPQNSKYNDFSVTQSKKKKLFKQGYTMQTKDMTQKAIYNPKYFQLL